MVERSDAPFELVRIDGGFGLKKGSLTCDPCRSHESYLNLRESFPRLRKPENLRIPRSTLNQSIRQNELPTNQKGSYRGEAREGHLIHGV